MKKYLKMLLFPLILSNGAIHLLTKNIDNNAKLPELNRAERQIKEISLGYITDLKKETVENAIRNYYRQERTQFLQRINIRRIGLNQAEAEIVTSFENSELVRDTSTIQFYFTPISLQLSHIIPNRNIQIPSSGNFRRTIITTLRRHNPQYYDSSIWDRIRWSDHQDNYRQITSNYINFHQFLSWDHTLRYIGNNNPIQINVSLQTQELHMLSITRSLGDLGENVAVTAEYILQRFKQLNPRIDATNLRVIEIRENASLLATNRNYITIMGSAVVTITDSINHNHPIYTNRVLVNFSFHQRVATINTDLQEIESTDPNHILKRFLEKNTWANHFDLSVSGINITSNGTGYAIISGRNKPYGNTYKVNFVCKKIPLSKIVTTTTLKDLSNLNLSYIFDQFCHLNPGIDPTNLIITGIKINNDRISGIIRIKPAPIFMINPKHPIYDDNAGIELSFSIKPITLRNVALITKLTEVERADQEHILKRFQQLNPAVNTGNLSVTNINVTNPTAITALIRAIGSNYDYPLYDDDNSGLAVTFSVKKLSLLEVAENSELGIIDVPNKSSILTRFAQLNPAIDPTNLSVTDIDISSAAGATAIIMVKNSNNNKPFYNEDERLQVTFSVANFTLLPDTENNKLVKNNHININQSSPKITGNNKNDNKHTSSQLTATLHQNVIKIEL